MESNSYGKTGQIEVNAKGVTLEQLDRIMSYFGRHEGQVAEVSAEYDFHTKELRLSGEPATSAHVALQSLTEAIRAARAIHPSDSLDMSV